MPPIRQIDAIARLAEIYRQKTLVPCTACRYCLPCPAGVNIPQNFAILNNISMEHSRIRRWMARRGYKRLASSTEKLDKENPNGNASLCVACGQCLPKCPQQIRIPEELKKGACHFGETRPDLRALSLTGTDQSQMAARQTRPYTA